MHALYTRYLACGVAASALLAAPVCYAQSPADKAAAETLFTEGRRLMAAGDLAEACKKLAGSQKLDPGAGTLLNLAACYERNRQLASAWVTYRDAAAASRDRHPDWAEKASRKATELEPLLCHLTVAITSPTAGLEVTRDEQPMNEAMFGTALPVDEGEHTVVARAIGRKPFTAKIRLTAAGEAQTITVPLLESDAPAASLAVPTATGVAVAPRPATSTQRTVGLVLGAAGVIGLGVGSVIGVVALGKKTDAAANCSGDYQRCNQTGIDLVNSAKAMGALSTVSLIGGGVLAAGGLALALTAPSGAGKPAAVEARLGAPGANLGVSVGGAF